MFKMCILYNSKFSFTAKCLGTNAVVVKRVHCNLVGFVLMVDSVLMTYLNVKVESFFFIQLELHLSTVYTIWSEML